MYIQDLMGVNGFRNSTAASAALRKPAVSLADSTDLRVIITILYIMVETMRVEEATDTECMKGLRETFILELGEIIVIFHSFVIEIIS